MKKLFNLNSTLKLGAQYPKIHLLSAITVMQVWIEDNFWFLPDCFNSFNCSLEKLIKKQIIIFYSPSNALCSSDSSIWIKQFNHHTFRFPFHLVQSANTDFLLINPNLQMCVIVKTRCFYILTISSQSKLKKFNTLFLRYLPRKSRCEI